MTSPCSSGETGGRAGTAYALGFCHALSGTFQGSSGPRASIIVDDPWPELRNVHGEVRAQELKTPEVQMRGF